jgi:ubiquinone/menaquinone biosynthesis C-methylase UbiE
MSTHPHSALFSDVDHSKDPDFFIRFMDEAQKPAGMAESKRLMQQRMALTPGTAVLEVGCGPGADLLDLTEAVGPASRIVGVDASEVMVAEARQRAAEKGLPVTVEVGDVEALAFADASFDVCRAARLLEHLPDAGPALSEMIRVTRPNGRIVVFDFDWDTLIIDHPDKETTRTVVRTYCDSIRNGWIGRQLPRLFKEGGLTDVSLDAVQVFVHYAMVELFLGSHLARLQEHGVLAPDQARRWWAYLEDATERGTLLVSFTAFVVVGTVG